MVPEDSSVILPIGEFPFWINPHNFARRKTMANIKKINRGNALNVIRHITRSCMNYKNQDIDSERTELNTHWNENNAIEEYNKRLKIGVMLIPLLVLLLACLKNLPILA